MEYSILAGRDRISLNNGMDLRLLSALEVLQARREAAELAGEERERALCSNACLLARALEHSEDHSPVFSGGREVLSGLTVEEIVRGGVQDGVFLTPYPEGTGTLVLQLGASFSDAIAALLLSPDTPPDTAKILENLELYRYAVEQILGAPYGSIVLYQMRQMVEVCTAIFERHVRLQRGLSPLDKSMDAH